MKKLIFFTKALCVITVLFSTLCVYSMEKICHCSLYEECQAQLTRKKQIKKNSEQSHTYNQENPLIKLTTNSMLKENILPYCRAQDIVRVTELYFSIKNFLALSATCKHFNTILTLQTIGTLCKDYTVTDKNELLQRLLLFSTKNKRRLMTTILTYAGVNVNTTITVHHPLEVTYSSLGNAIADKDTSLISLLLDYHANPNQLIKCEPALFCTETRTTAQMLINKGANIHATSFTGENILWHIISNEMPAKLIQFYAQKGVATTNIRKRDNACLLHHLASKAHPHVSDPDNFLKQSRRLLAILPEMINAVNKNNQTPLDLAQMEKKNNLTPRVLKKLIKLFKKHDGKTAQKLAQQASALQRQMSQENEARDCIICLHKQDNMIGVPCINIHPERICTECYTSLLNDRCPICRRALKK